MPVPITALYAGILALIGVGLAAGSGTLRAKTGVSLGDGGNQDQLLAMRRHGNFTEWVPLTVLLFALMELNGAPSLALHILGVWLVVARILHPIGLGVEMQSVARTIGAASTALITVIAAIWSITTFF